MHLDGEFAESNLGTAQERDGSLTARLIADQYAFVPDCVKVPVDTPVKFRLTSTDVIHGFLLPATNVNTMVVPGFVAEVRTRFNRPGVYHMPCNEFCGAGHHGMWARVIVVPKEQFPALQQPKGQAVHNSSRLALYHYWVAFAVFLPAVDARRLADADAQSAAGAARRSQRLLRLGDAARHRDGLCGHDLLRDGVWLCGDGDEPGPADPRRDRGVDRLRHLPDRHVDGGRRVLSGSASVLYTFYPPLLASAWYYLGAALLIGGSMIWVVLMVYQYDGVETRPSGPAGAARNVRDHCDRAAWAWAASGVDLEMWRSCCHGRSA